MQSCLSSWRSYAALRHSFMRYTSHRSRSVTAGSKDLVVTEHLSGDKAGIAVIRMQYSEKKNALSGKFLESFNENLSKLKIRLDTKVVIVKSDVPGTFCAGADLKERAELSDADVLPFVDKIRALTTDLANLPMPVIAAINGWALGGGLELALGADIRVAFECSRMGLIETKWSLLPGGGGSQRLPRTIGVSLAKELIYTARIVDGMEAARIGLVNHAIPGTEDAAYEKSIVIAKEIIKNGPLAVRAAKIAITLGSEVDLATGLRIEQQCYGTIVPLKDRQEGMRAFREKRPPVYTGK